MCASESHTFPPRLRMFFDNGMACVLSAILKVGTSRRREGGVGVRCQNVVLHPPQRRHARHSTEASPSWFLNVPAQCGQSLRELLSHLHPS
jgi:hypothetical protein